MDARSEIVVVVRGWLRAVLQARGLSPEAWSAQAGVDPVVLAACLNRTGHVPSMRVLARLAAAVDLPPPDLERGSSLRLIKGGRQQD